MTDAEKLAIGAAIVRAFDASPGCEHLECLPACRMNFEAKDCLCARQALTVAEAAIGAMPQVVLMPQMDEADRARLRRALDGVGGDAASIVPVATFDAVRPASEIPPTTAPKAIARYIEGEVHRLAQLAGQAGLPYEVCERLNAVRRAIDAELAKDAYQGPAARRRR